MAFTINQPFTRLIICGPDKCGKTTLLTALSKTLNVPVFKSGREKSIFHHKDAQMQTLRYGVPLMLDLIKLYQQNIIFDRFYPCEYAYSKTYSRETDLEALAVADTMWNFMGGKIIYLYKTIPFEKDDIADYSKHKTLLQYYDEYFAKYAKSEVIKLCSNESYFSYCTTLAKELNFTESQTTALINNIEKLIKK